MQSLAYDKKLNNSGNKAKWKSIKQEEDFNLDLLDKKGKKITKLWSNQLLNYLKLCNNINNNNEINYI